MRNHQIHHTAGTSVPSVRPTFRELLDDVRRQVSADTFSYRDRVLVEELCSIIAEVYFLAFDGKGTARVEGESLPYRLIGEVFGRLGAQHLEYVIERYRAVTSTVRNTKAYLRTALYNAVFEMELGRINEFRRDS